MKYLRFTTLGLKDLGIRQSEFVTKTQFIYISKSDSLLRVIENSAETIRDNISFHGKGRYLHDYYLKGYRCESGFGLKVAKKSIYSPLTFLKKILKD